MAGDSFSRYSTPRSQSSQPGSSGTLKSGGSTQKARATGDARAKTVRRVPRTHSVMFEYYERGDLPVSVDRPSTHPTGGSLIWEVCMLHTTCRSLTRQRGCEVEPNLLDYDTYLPMFFGGLLEIEGPQPAPALPKLLLISLSVCAEPYALFARRGILDMVQHGDDDAIAEAVPLVIPHIRGVVRCMSACSWRSLNSWCCSGIGNRGCTHLRHDDRVCAVHSAGTRLEPGTVR